MALIIRGIVIAVVGIAVLALSQVLHPLTAQTLGNDQPGDTAATTSWFFALVAGGAILVGIATFLVGLVRLASAPRPEEDADSGSEL